MMHAISSISKDYSEEEVFKNFLNSQYRPDYSHLDNPIFYYAREVSLKKNVEFNKQNVEVLKKMEGVAEKINLTSYSFDSNVLVDGSLAIDVDYNEELEVTGSNRVIKSVKLII